MEHSQDALDKAIDNSLVRGAEPRIPPDFAAKVVAALPSAPPARKVSQLGARMATVAAIALFCAIFLLAPHSSPTFASSAFDVELLLLAQLAAIAFWLAVRRRA